MVVKAKPSERTNCCSQCATTPSSMAEEVSAFVNPSVKGTKASNDVSNTSNPQKVTKFRKYIVNADNQIELGKTTNLENLSIAIDVIRCKLGDDDAKRFLFNEMEVEDNVNACVFYLLEVMLLANDKRKSVSREYFKIMQNLELHEKYPGGSLSYDTMNEILHNAVNCNNTSNTYSLGVDLVMRIILFSQPMSQNPLLEVLKEGYEEKNEAYITSFFNSITYHRYDGLPLVVKEVDDTTIGSSSELAEELARGSFTVQGDTSPKQTPMATTSTSPPLQNSDSSLQLILLDLSAYTENEDTTMLMYDSDRQVEESQHKLLMDCLDDSSRSSYDVDIMVLDTREFHTF
ncbi:hypothetical protein FNV43_RR05666 [Rhamnella rubrinervis]|uniref:Uncharacterized protein n=1 Tax=Rhamnella rubrinervis TaxID=2594499 RepID=A0A8K0HPF7_9ROSA|nr:hypothetical protein FNV43_RR05666 [Rhamnella rubrinervis]